MQYSGPNHSAYTMVGHDQHFPAPHGRNVPRYPSTAANRSSGNGCGKCCCCLFCIILILFLIMAVVVAAGFAVVNPSLPKYTIAEFASNEYKFTSDNSKLHARFAVTVKADNPNKFIRFVYQKDSTVDLLFRDGKSNSVKLSSGHIPAFTQPIKNVTTLKIELKADLTKGDFGSSLDAFKSKVKTSEIPLVVEVKAPVNVILGGNEVLKNVKINAKCSMEVNTLSPGKGIKMSEMIYESTTYKLYDN